MLAFSVHPFQDLITFISHWYISSSQFFVGFYHQSDIVSITSLHVIHQIVDTVVKIIDQKLKPQAVTALGQSIYKTTCK